MAALLSPARILQRIFRHHRGWRVIRRGARRPSIQERLTYAIAETLEPRVLMTVATHLAFVGSLSDATAGAALSSIIVDVDGLNDQPVGGNSSLVIFTLTSGPDDSLGNTFAVQAQNGVAELDGLSFTEAGAYAITASSGSLAPATSNTFNVTPDVASQLVITQQSGSETAGNALPPLSVAVEDQYGNIVTTDNSDVTAGIASGPGSLGGTATIAADGGVATFNNLSITRAGAYTLSLADGELTEATSNSLTVSPAAASQLVITGATGGTSAGSTLPALEVSVEDQYGNVVTTDNSNVTVSVATGSGSLSGTLTEAASSGAATFSNLSLTQADAYTLGVADDGLIGTTTASFNITPATASKVVFSGQPAGSTAGALETVFVAVEDPYGNIVTSDNSQVTLAKASGSGELVGTLTANAVNGIATFDTLALQTSDTYTLGASDDGLAGATSNSFAITPGAATQLAFTNEPTSVATGDLGTIVVSVEDQYGNVVTSDNSTVSLALASGSGLLLGTTTATASSGVASFSSLALHVPGSFTLGATDGQIGSATSDAFTVSPGSAAQLGFYQQPTNVTVGNLGTVEVAVEDQYGNVVTGDNSSVTVSLASGSGSLLGTTTQTASGGIATFSDLAIGTPGSFTLGAVDDSLTPATSSSFSTTAGTAAQLVFTTQPIDASAGITLSAVTVSVEDQLGNVLTSAHPNITIAVKRGGSTFNIVVGATNGVATLSGIAMIVAGDYSLKATSGSLASATSNSFTVSPAAAAQLVIGQQPADATAGSTLGAITVKVEDIYGNVVTGDSSNITAAVNTGSGSFSGTTIQPASSGIATFNDLASTTADDYTLSFSDGNFDGTVTSNSFTINPSTPSQVVLQNQPTDTLAGGLGNIAAAIEDQYGNLVTSNHANIVASIASGTGTLLGTVTVTPENGIADFDDLAIQRAGTFTLDFTNGSASDAISDSFTVSPETARQLVVTQQTNHATAGGTLDPLTVSVEDQYGNVVTTDNSVITVAIATGSGTLAGTLTATASSGVASFSGLSTTTADTYTLGFTDGELAPATSSSFTVSPAIAAKLEILTEPAGSAAGAIGTLQVAVEDQYGNIVTSDNSNVTVAVDTGSGSLLGTLTVTAGDGIATFSDLAIHTPDTYILAMSDIELTGIDTDSFAISPAAANHLVFTASPSSTTVGDLGTATVEVEDQFDNLVTSDSSQITLSIASGSGALLGTTTVAALNGTASFSDLALDTAGSFTLGAADGQLNGATTGGFVLSADAADHLSFVQEPSDQTAGGTLDDVYVAIEDQYDNIVTSDTADVTIQSSGGPSSFTGTTTVAAVGGIADFGDLVFDGAGSYVLQFSSNSVLGTTSSIFTISPAAANKLAILSEPTSTSAGAIGTLEIGVEDQYGNIVTVDNSSVSISLTSGSGTLLGTLTQNAIDGVARFSDLAIHTPDSYVIGAAESGLTSAATDAFTIAPAAADHLVITPGISDAMAGTTLDTITVQVEDQYGNVVTSDNSSITLQAAGGPAALSGTTTATAASGVATFSNLSLNLTGSYTIGASDSGLTGASTESFAITPATAAKLGITGQPFSGNAGALNIISIAVEDQYGNVVTSDDSNVTVAIAGGDGTLLGTLTQAADGGIATFSDLAIQLPDTYTLSFADTGLTGTTSNDFTLSASTPSKLAITEQTSSTIAGSTLSTLSVAVEDQFGNIVTDNGSDVTIRIASGGNEDTTLGGTVTVAASDGIATFSNLSLTQAGTYTLGAFSDPFDGAISEPFTISPAAASKLDIVAEPGPGTVGALGTLTVQVEDQYGNLVTTDNSDVTISLNGSGTLLGTLTQAASGGVATFSDLALHTAGTFSIGAADDSLIPQTTDNFTLTPGDATKLAITQQTASGTAGSSLSALDVAVEDQYGNIVTTDNSSILSTVASGGGLLFGGRSVNADSGVASFSDLTITQSGSYTLGFSDGLLTPATSNSFTVSPGSATELAFTVQPTTTVAGNALATVSVAVEDPYGNIVTTDNSNITLAASTGSGTITLINTASSGVASFNGFALSTTGSYNLRATDGSLTAATSNSFNITPAAANKLAIMQAPSSNSAGALGNLVVQVEDQYGNIETSDNSNVTVSIASGTGSLLGTLTVPASSGIATFSDLAMHTPGAFTLGVSDNSLTPATTDGFNITPASASKVVITQQTSSTAAGGTLSSLVADVEDQYGNIVTTDNSNVTISIASGGNPALGGALSEAASSGIATFSDLSLTQAGTYTLGVADGSLTGDTSGAFTISAAAANKLAITQQTSSAAAGDTLSSIQVSVEDQYGNVVTPDNSAVTLAIATGSGSLSGTLTQTAAGGVATFSGLSIQQADSYTLQATDIGLASATTNSFTIEPSSPFALTVSQGTANISAGGLGTITVDVVDQYNNLVTTDNSDVAVALTGGSGTLLGTTTVTAEDGVATFSDLAIHTPGSFNLTFSDSSLFPGAASYTIAPAAAAQLVITQQTASATAGGTLSTLIAQIEDQYGNLVTTDNSEVTAGIATGTGELGGTITVQASGGVVSFSNLSLTQAGSFTLQLAEDGLTSATSDSFTISPAGAAKIAITQQPGDVATGALGTIIAAVEDQYGNLVTSNNSDVTASIASGAGTLLGTATVTAEEGVATFSDLAIHTPGAFTLTFADEPLTPATSSSFQITPAATMLVFTQEPSTASVAGSIPTAVTVEDAYGNVVTTDSSTITLAISTGPSGSVLGGTVSLAATNGVANFTTDNLSKAGAFTLSATDGSLTAATSNSFDIQSNAAPTGSVGTANTTTITGWAFDSDAGATPIQVQITIDGVAQSPITAGNSRSDLTAVVGSADHGFTYSIPTLSIGTHTINVYAINSPAAIGSSAEVLLKSYSATIPNTPPIGSVGTATATTVAGWAYDADAGAASINVGVVIDGVLITPFAANTARSDLTAALGSANHGFSYTLPTLAAGAHTVSVYAYNSPAATGSAAVVLLKTYKVTVTNALPIGSVGTATSTQISGWAYDANAGAAPILVRVDIDGVTGTPFAANTARSDLASVLGSANHGFTYNLPTLTPGSHNVKVYAINSPVATGSASQVLLKSYSFITAGSNSVAPIGSVNPASTTTVSGWAYDAEAGNVPIMVRVDIDGVAGTAFVADGYRFDLFSVLGSTEHGFTYTLPTLVPGPHTISVYAINPAPGALNNEVLLRQYVLTV